MSIPIPTINEYQYWCSTEQKTIRGHWSPTEPTVCLNDTGHTIDVDSMTVKNTINQSKIIIKADGIDGKISATTRKLVIGAGATGSVSTFEYSSPIQSGINCLVFTTTAEHTDDEIEILVAPDTTIGVMITDATIGDTVFTVSPTVIEYLVRGFFVTFTDGVNSDDLGRVIDINTDTSQITMEFATTNNYTGNATYVNMTVKMMHGYIIGPPMTHRLGADYLGSSTVAANTIIRIVYKNSSGAAKNFYIYPELVY